MILLLNKILEGGGRKELKGLELEGAQEESLLELEEMLRVLFLLGEVYVLVKWTGSYLHLELQERLRG